MKKSLLMLMLLAVAGLLAAMQGTINLSDSPTASNLLRNTMDGLSVRYNIQQLDYKEVETPEGVFTDLWVDGYASTNKTGYPRLPLLRQIISVPVGAEVTATFNQRQSRSLDLNANGIAYPVFPRQESVSKSVDPATVPFVVERDFYNRNAWTDDAPVSVTELGYMRGERLFALDFVPVRYNPATGQAEVIYQAEVEVRFTGADHAATEELKARTYSPAFESMFQRTLLNPSTQRASLNRYPMSYLIITPESFVSALQPFVEWKTREGFNVIVATTAQTGSTASAIRTYIQNIWNSATAENPAPSYLLIVGDVAQVPANNASANPSGHITDLTYVRLQGNDFMPEMYFGRFSATDAAAVTNQVNKTLMHEQYAMPDDSYLGNVVMIAGVDSYWSPSHANGAINYATNNYFNAAHGITSNTYLYPASQTSSSAIIQNVSAGRGYVNYTAHGSETTWADPSFTISNINSLQNTNKYSYVVGNCCSTNAFDTGTCFGEAWLRALNKGAVIYIGGTNSTYWDEDYWWAVGHKPPIVGTGSPFVAGRTGAYDALFHDHNEPFADWASCAGSNVFMGNMAVVQSNSSRINYYWEVYSIMGDPSLVPYLGIPAVNSFEAPQTILMGLNSLEVIADPFSYVALSMNNVLHGVGLTDADGYLTLNYTPFSEPGTAQIVITRSLRKPVVANVQVIPNTGAYVTVSPLTVVDPNSNGIAEAGETISLNLTFNNVGSLPANNLVATLSTTCTDVTLLENTANLGNIPANGSYVADSIFSIQIHPSIPDQTVVAFDITVSDGNDQWVTTRNMTVNSPNLAISSMMIVDPNNNGFLEPGENITITIDVTNNGHMDAPGGTVNIVANHPSVSLNISQFTLPPLSVGVVIPLNFIVSLGTDIPNGTVIPIGIAISAGIQNVNHNLMLAIGMIGDGFETGDFTAFNWTNNSPIPWTIQSGSANAHSGEYCAKSGAIGNNGSTSLSITMNVGSDSNISFWRKVSSETGYDMLRFSIDGIEMGTWSGTQGWAQVSYPVGRGNRTFEWKYTKDVSVSSGNDCAWIDDVVFPMSGDSNIPLIFVPTPPIVFANVNANDVLAADFMIRNLGTAELSGLISVPEAFELSLNGTPLPDTYSYSIPANQNMVFTLGYTAPDPAVNLEGQITISSNDPDSPTVTIPITVQAFVSATDPVAPKVTRLEGNYPNPFNPETMISFATHQSGPVKLSIYNLKGQLVRSLLDSELPAGQHKLVWNGRDNSNNPVASGIYFYRMEAGKYSKTMKMMLIK